MTKLSRIDRFLSRMHFADREPARDDESLTVRMPRRALALVVAIVVHAGVMFLVDRMPEPKPVQRPIELTITSSPPCALVVSAITVS